MTSGRCSATRLATCVAVGDDVDQPDLALGVQEPADVLRDLGHVLDEEQANLIGRCHPQERYHAFPIVPDQRLITAAPTGAARSAGLPRDEDDAVAARLERRELVVAGELLDLEAGRLGERDQLVGRDQAQRVVADPARRRLARRALLEDRRERDEPAEVLVPGGELSWSPRGPCRDPCAATPARAGRRTRRGPRGWAATRRRRPRRPGARSRAIVRERRRAARRRSRAAGSSSARGSRARYGPPARDAPRRRSASTRSRFDEPNARGDLAAGGRAMRARARSSIARSMSTPTTW